MTDIAQSPVASVGPQLYAAMLRFEVPYSRPWVGWIVTAIIVLAWQISASLGWITDAVMPSPYAVAAAAWRLTLSGELVQNLGVSALRALAGLAVGGGIGLMLGFLNDLSRLSYSVTDTSVQMIRNVSHLALIPMVIVWFGIDEGRNSLSSRSASSFRSTSIRCVARVLLLERQRKFDLMLERRQCCCKRTSYEPIGVSRIQSRRPENGGGRAPTRGSRRYC